MSLPFIPLYVDDYEAATAHLTIEEDGAYNRLLRLCWRTPGCSVPDDPKWIMRKMRVSADDYYRVVEPLIDEFFTRGMGRVFQARLQAEFDKATASHEAKSAAGKKGNEVRWQKNKPLKNNKTGNRNANAMGSQPEPYPEPEPKGDKSPLTPLEILKGVLSEECARDFLDHRKAKRAKMTPRAAELIAGKLAGHPDPDSCAYLSIQNGWTGVFPENQPKGRSNGPDGTTVAAAGARIAEQLRGR